MKRSFPILRRLFQMILVLILGLMVCFTGIRKLSGNQLPMPFGIGMANVLSGSMEPTFSRGTLLIIRKTQTVSKGDIVVYQSGQSLVVHRVTDIQKDQIITQGDANNAPDPAFAKTKIRGIVIFWIPYLGRILNAIHTPGGAAVLLFGFFLLESVSGRMADEDRKKQRTKPSGFFLCSAVLTVNMLLCTWLLTDLYAGYRTQASCENSAGTAKFDVEETGTLTRELSDISMVPGSRAEYELKVTNKSEIAVRYSISVLNSDRNLPLEFKLYSNSAAEGQESSMPGETLLSEILPANDSQLHTYMLEITWPTGENRSGQDEDYTGKTDAFVVTLKAEQAECAATSDLFTSVSAKYIRQTQKTGVVNAQEISFTSEFLDDGKHQTETEENVSLTEPEITDAETENKTAQNDISSEISEDMVVVEAEVPEENEIPDPVDIVVEDTEKEK